MMPTFKKTLSLASVLTLAVVTLGATGCGRHHRPDPARMEKMVTHQVDDALDDLKATPEQRQKIGAVKDRLLASGRAMHGDRQATVKEALELWEAQGFDRARALSLVDARIDAMRTMAHQAVDAAAEVHATLTPEQRAQVSKKLHRHLDE
jgi:Spy/CpxP family protein refolding chaperone